MYNIQFSTIYMPPIINVNSKTNCEIKFNSNAVFPRGQQVANNIISSQSDNHLLWEIWHFSDVTYKEIEM